jgi:hypothetical protein
MTENVAVTVVALFIVTTHVVDVEVHPLLTLPEGLTLQPRNVCVGVSVRVTLVPCWNLDVSVLGGPGSVMLIPVGLLVTVPLPDPFTVSEIFPKVVNEPCVLYPVPTLFVA